jgi:hypothetical protein
MRFYDYQPNEVAAAADEATGMLPLDIATGTGRTASPLARRCRGRWRHPRRRSSGSTVRRDVKTAIEDRTDAAKKYKSAPGFAPAGQSTQMIVGDRAERRIIDTAQPEPVVQRRRSPDDVAVGGGTDALL